ncbi:heterokaryon incompatibility protein-domain-containing protein [Diaporthe sp. PMI_573]|nr:heterokaryon incompatibility protein-domain-containing protein [Diaporthaceae sp. PMI_573]
MDDPRPPRHPDFYRPLPPGFTRVFELEAGHFTDPIVGRLVAQAIDREPYEAVSYVWGDARKRHDITIDGVKLSITANLHGALTAFRPQPHGPQSGSSDGSEQGASSARLAQRQVRRLWADAVCINQQDLLERTAQVELMGQIFAGARRVIAWLGWEEGEVGRRHTQAAIRYIHSFMEDPKAGLLDARVLLHHDVTDPAEHLTHLSEDDRRRFEEQAHNWEAIKVFFQIEYFHRTWIVQELGLAREAILHTALKPTDATEAVKDGEATERKTQVMEHDFIDWPLVGQFVKFLDFSAASLVTHLGLLSWVATHIMLVWDVEEDGTHKSDFLTGMHWARILRVTDALDRVYSLLGHPLAVLDGGLVIKPEYTITRGVAYTKLAANFIRKTKNLHAVSFVDHEDDPSVETRDWDPQDDGRMPSWVPDWHSINRTTPMNYSIDCLVDAAEPKDPEIQIVGNADSVKGTPLPHLLVRGWVVDEISAVSRRMETTDFPVTHPTRERAKTNPFWLDRVWELVFPAEGSTDRDALAVLESLSLALPFGTRGKDHPASLIGPQQTLEEHHQSFAAYVLDYHELRRGASEAGGVDDDGYLPARSLYDSLPAEAQAELRRRAEGTTSGGFLECMTWPSMCRVVYRTVSGLVGMGSRVTRPGDLVCRVRGSSVLMTLRRIKESGAGQVAGTETETDAAPISCAHIGPTVMPARMEKDVIDGGEYGEKAAHFRIV